MKPEIEERKPAEPVSGQAEVERATMQPVVAETAAAIVEESKEQAANQEEEKKSEPRPRVGPSSAPDGPLGKERAGLLAFAQKHLDAYDGLSVALASKRVPGLEVRQYPDPDVGGAMVSITKGKVPGLTIAKYLAFLDDVLKHTPLLDAKRTMKRLDDIQGHGVTHTLINMPAFLTNRSVFNLYHRYHQDDGSYVDLCSYVGTEDLVESAAGKKAAGRTVIALNHIDYRLLEPYDDGANGSGCYWTSILCTDVRGSLPVSL